ncbi:LysR substrate-binding domain-containing protein [Salinicola tamaricis]|uniref:LysR substrate-binding domain-containing protein n=1 Tax=Salinicola tamaricis TaxID=1771309 RepID=UPI000D0A0463|nr:LysR substrate-binding domain-containing protein [Salinicola tamaricis]
MSHPLPPLNPLRAFEVAARLCSLTKAAEELHVSQVAVSRQVKVLEDYMGVVLFYRQHRGIELTREGLELYRGVKNAFKEISDASRRVSRRGRKDVLSIQSYTTFSQRWLIPRLADFNARNDLLEVKLSSSLKPADFDSGNVDAAIRAGRGEWPDLHAEKLVDIELIPVVSPALQASAGIKTVRDLSRVRLLHSMARSSDWQHWLAAYGDTVEDKASVQFESSALAYEAASTGMGCAIAVKMFVEKQLESGEFLAPFPETLKTGEAYYLVWPKGTPPSDALLRFLEWMRGVMQTQTPAAPAAGEEGTPPARALDSLG